MELEENISGVCPECGNGVLVEDKARGEITCDKCGLVINQNIIDSGAEWRAYSMSEKKERARTGPPMTLTNFDKGLYTEVGKLKDIYGNQINSKRRKEILRLRKWNQRTKTNRPQERNLKNAMDILDRLGSQMRLTKEIKESAALIYRKAIKIIKGRYIEAMIIASVYIACRLHKKPKTIEDFKEFTEINLKTIAKCYRLIVYTLKIKIEAHSPINFIPRFSSKLKLPATIQSRAVNILNVVNKYNLFTGKSPQGVAGGAIYAASLQEGQRCTQHEISAVAGVTEGTIRKNYKALIRYLNYEIMKAKDNRSLKNCEEIIQINIVYYGPPRSGKTTNFKILQKTFASNNLTEGYSIASSNGSTLWQDSFFILLKFELNNIRFGLIIHIITIPGNERYISARKRILEGADGLIFVGDSNPEMMEQNKHSFQEFFSFVESNNIPFVIQLNKRDFQNAVSIDEFKKKLGLPLEKRYPDGAPVIYNVKALEGKNVIKCFRDLIIKVIFNQLKLNYNLS